MEGRLREARKAPVALVNNEEQAFAFQPRMRVACIDEGSHRSAQEKMKVVWHGMIAF